MNFDPYTQETTKVEEIKDCFGNVKFKVTLNPIEDSQYATSTTTVTWDATYYVKVISYCVSGETEPITLIEELFDELNDATQFFYNKVAEYKALVAAETKGWQDIRIFNDQIHYKIIDPNCCKNCKYAKPITKDNCLFNDWKQHKGRFYCMNPKIAKIQKEIDPRVEDPRETQSPYYYDGQRVTVNFELAPVVQEDGICDDYIRNYSALSVDFPNGTACSPAHFDCHMTSTAEQLRDTEIQFEVNRKVDDKLNNIKIKQIIGNDNDANQNGIKDDSESYVTIGNLGA